jgi:hypothetical protein
MHRSSWVLHTPILGKIKIIILKRVQTFLKSKMNTGIVLIKIFH